MKTARRKIDYKAVWARDGGVCAHCGSRPERRSDPPYHLPSRNGWAVDHIKAVWQFASEDAAQANNICNLQTLCEPCHKRKTREDKAASLVILMQNRRSSGARATLPLAGSNT